MKSEKFCRLLGKMHLDEFLLIWLRKTCKKASFHHAHLKQQGLKYMNSWKWRFVSFPGMHKNYGSAKFSSSEPFFLHRGGARRRSLCHACNYEALMMKSFNLMRETWGTTNNTIVTPAPRCALLLLMVH